MWLWGNKNKVVTYHRTFERHGGDRKGNPIAKPLARPKNLDFWASIKRNNLRGELMKDAARLLHCPMDDVVLMDQGHTITAWRYNGHYAEVVTYERY
jgi:hypothetical protein